MTDKINIVTAYEWLENHYAGVPGIWEQFDQEVAAESLVDNVCELTIDNYDDLPVLDLMCIMADARM